MVVEKEEANNDAENRNPIEQRGSMGHLRNQVHENGLLES